MRQALQFSVHAPPHPATIIRTKQQIFCKLHHLNPEEMEVTPGKVQLALKRTKASKALGPVGLAPIHLQHLGTSGFHYLTTVINLSINSTKIPHTVERGRHNPASQAKQACRSRQELPPDHAAVPCRQVGRQASAAMPKRTPSTSRPPTRLLQQPQHHHSPQLHHTQDQHWTQPPQAVRENHARRP